ncbi:MAG: hypothetical protein AB7R55_00380 [Gemmatimonadales bacterium]
MVGWAMAWIASVGLVAPTGGRAHQLPSIETMVTRLAEGRLVLDRVRFRQTDDHLAQGYEALLEQAARALNRSQGKFAVYVPAELTPSLPADTVLSRRRSFTAYRALLAAGSNPAHLVGPVEAARLASREIRAVRPGDARIELLRIE